jgi:hypothetical protein
MSIGIELIIPYSELPPSLQSKDRQLQSNTRHAIWLDERQVIEIKPFQVCGLANVRFAQEEDGGEDKIIYEIIYYHQGRKKAVIRNACNRHLLPAELHRPDPPPSPEIPVLKVFIDIYYDDFGPYRWVYHALGGVYITIGNMPLCLRQKLRHVYLLGFIPFDVLFHDFILPLSEELAALQKGKLWYIEGKPHWVVIGTIFYSIIDLTLELILSYFSKELDLLQPICLKGTYLRRSNVLMRSGVAGPA